MGKHIDIQFAAALVACWLAAVIVLLALAGCAPAPAATTHTEETTMAIDSLYQPPDYQRPLSGEVVDVGDPPNPVHSVRIVGQGAPVTVKAYLENSGGAAVPVGAAVAVARDGNRTWRIVQQPPAAVTAGQTNAGVRDTSRIDLAGNPVSETTLAAGDALSAQGSAAAAVVQATVGDSDDHDAAVKIAASSQGVGSSVTVTDTEIDAAVSAGVGMRLGATADFGAAFTGPASSVLVVPASGLPATLSLPVSGPGIGPGVTATLQVSDLLRAAGEVRVFVGAAAPTAAGTSGFSVVNRGGSADPLLMTAQWWGDPGSVRLDRYRSDTVGRASLVDLLNPVIPTQVLPGLSNTNTIPVNDWYADWHLSGVLALPLMAEQYPAAWPALAPGSPWVSPYAAVVMVNATGSDPLFGRVTTAPGLPVVEDADGNAVTSGNAHWESAVYDVAWLQPSPLDGTQTQAVVIAQLRLAPGYSFRLPG